MSSSFFSLDSGNTSISYNNPYFSSSGTVFMSPYMGTTTINYPNYNWGTGIGTTVTTDNIYNNQLKNLIYSIEFEIDKDDILKNSIKSIENKKIIFNCNYIVNRIQPYEFIMKLINEEKKFFIKIKVSDILSICYKNFQFTKIENNLNFGANNCDFSVIKVKFKYDEITYQNHKLSLKELRTDKIKKIMSEK